MLSRREFLACSISTASFGIGLEFLGADPALARRKKKVEPIAGPHVLAQDSWPPAIEPEFIAVDRKGFACLVDQFGRMSVVDMRKAGKPGVQPEVVAQLSGFDNRARILDFSLDDKTGYLLAKELEGEGQPGNLLCAVSLRNVSEPFVISNTKLDSLSSADCIATERRSVAIAGTSKNGQSTILIMEGPIDRGHESARNVASISTKIPVTALHLERRELTVLMSKAGKSQLEFYNLSNPASPVLSCSLEMDGNMTRLARYKSSIYVIGDENPDPKNKKTRKLVARSISLKPAPHAIASTPLETITEILSTEVEKDSLIILGRSKDNKLLINRMAIDRYDNLNSSQVLYIPGKKAGSTRKATLKANRRTVYLACGWSGVLMLKSNRGELSIDYTYKIPQLAAGGIATWGSNVVLSGGELMLYDISDPERPKLVKSAPMQASIRSMVGAGSFILTLAQNQLTLRKMSSLDQVVASSTVKGQDLAFDKTNHRAYVVEPLGKLTRIHPLKVFSDNIENMAAFEIPANYKKIEAASGTIALYDITDLTLFKISDKIRQVGKRKFDKLAIRDVCLTDEYLLATAIDQNQKGFLLVLDKEDKDLNVKGTIDLPHNGVSVSAKGNKAVCIGKDSEGKDAVSIISLASPAAPEIVKTMKALEAASVVAIESELAFVAGRGLEILTL